MIFLFLSDICYPNNTTLNRKADSLFNKGLYIESTLLYELEIFNTDNLEKINYLLLKKTKALRYSNNIKEAYRNLFRINATQILNDTLLSEYYFELTFCSYLTGNYEIAKEYASEINNDYIKNDMYSLLKCMIYLKSSEYDTLYYLISTNNLLHDSLLADYEIQYTKQKEIYTKINTISNKKKNYLSRNLFF